MPRIVIRSCSVRIESFRRANEVLKIPASAILHERTPARATVQYANAPRDEDFRVNFFLIFHESSLAGRIFFAKGRRASASRCAVGLCYRECARMVSESHVPLEDVDQSNVASSRRYLSANEIER